MTTHKVADLTGALLDATVAKAEWPDREIEIQEYNAGGMFAGVMGLDEPEYFGEYHPSTDWSVGGPIIERERIALIMQTGLWRAWMVDPESRGDGNNPDYWLFEAVDSTAHGSGDTPLIAAMRAYVASKFGETVELP